MKSMSKRQSLGLCTATSYVDQLVRFGLHPLFTYSYFFIGILNVFLPFANQCANASTNTPPKIGPA